MNKFWRNEFNETKKYLTEKDIKEIEKNDSKFPELNMADSSEERNEFLSKMTKKELIEYYCKNMNKDINTVTNGYWGGTGRGTREDIRFSIIQATNYFTHSTACIIRFSHPRYFGEF